jgi:hypothetical protein
MRKAATALLIFLGGLSWTAFAQEAPEFSLAAHAGPAPPSLESTFRRVPDGAAGVSIPAGLAAPELAGPIVKKGVPAPVSLSIFMGRGHGDLFSELHETYAWRTIFKSMNLGAGISRDISITRSIRVRPYVGVIRSSARLRPSYLYANAGSFEYRLTALCIGLPLVCVFD